MRHLTLEEFIPFIEHKLSTDIEKHLFERLIEVIRDAAELEEELEAAEEKHDAEVYQLRERITDLENMRVVH